MEVLKDQLDDRNAPFGVDLLIPQIGGSARRTNVSRDIASQVADILIAGYSTIIPMVDCPSW